jgi:sugar O-acyltransferase (sialic acid O-acetyltransferase NeuD family)
MKERVVILGAGLFAEVIHCYLNSDGRYEVIGFAQSKEYITDPEYLSLPVVPIEDLERHFPPDSCQIFIAIGYKNVNTVRAEFFNQLKARNYHFISYVHPSVKLWPNNKLGENCFIFEDNTIQPFVEVGDNTIMWSGNHIGHHSKIGKHCFIASHAVISGSCEIGDYCFIGVNATLRDSITVAPSCIIGAGTLIMKSTKEKSVYVADPTKPFRRNSDQLNF